MRLLERLFAKARNTAPTVAPETVPEPLHTMPDENFWGHHIEWSEFKDRRIWGHYDNFNGVQRFVLQSEPEPAPKLQVGSIIRAKMQSDRYALFRVTDLDWQRDPSDMFFGTVEDVGYEDEVRAAK